MSASYSFLCAASAIAIACLPMRVGAQTQPDAAPDVRNDVVFTEYAPLARSDELMRRFMTPLVVENIMRRATNAGMAFNQQAVDLAKEKFALFVPTRPPPPQGYSLMVFVPPWGKALVPPDWIPALESHGMIFVTAAGSGNTADILQRRNPLALLGAYNVMQHYRVDPSRVYVGGMSGGSRVALRIALSYPDLFHGAFLNAGSDSIGNLQAPLPSTELFHQFQESTRLVFFTGATDITNLYQDDDSRQSLRQWCVFDLYDETMPFAGHELATRRDFEHALNALEHHVAPNADTLASCRQRRDNELASKMLDVQKLIAKGKAAEASSLLKKIDEHFAGLAAPQSIQLSDQIAAQH